MLPVPTCAPDDPAPAVWVTEAEWVISRVTTIKSIIYSLDPRLPPSRFLAVQLPKPTVDRGAVQCNFLLDAS